MRLIIFQRALDALDRGRDAEKVLGADGPVGVAIALERKTFQRRERLGDGGCDFELIERGSVGHLDAGFVDPFARENRRCRIADDFAIAQDRRTRGDVDKRRLVALRDKGAKLETARKA
jgi:hypothetical protein